METNWKTFVINMKRSPERLVFMSEQLEKAGIPFDIQEGIDGKTHDFSNVYDEKLSRKHNGLPLADVELGCALSHRLILERVVREAIPYTLIMEDDIEIPSNFKIVVETAIRANEEGKENWEYLSFNYPTVGFKFIRLWLFLLSEQYKKRPTLLLYLKLPLYACKFLGIVLFSFVEGLRDHVYRNIYPLGKPAKFYRPIYLAGCYLVTLEGAKKLLSFGDKIIYPADRVQNVARIEKGLKLFWSVPLIVKQRRDKHKSTMYDNKDYVYEKYD